MADNDNRPYVGYRSAGRRPESRNDRVAAANAPLNVLRGWAAGTLGLPGDVESLVRMLPGISEKNTLPTTEYFEERLPLRDMSPTGRAFTGLGTLSGGAGVATGARAASRGAQALAPAAGALAMRAAELSGAPVYGMGVIKPKGGNWLAGSVEKAVEPLKSRVTSKPDIASDEQWAEYLKSDPNAVVNKWLETKLSKYIKNEMGTPEDPLRALAERGITHAETAPLNTYLGDTMALRRESAGFPAEGLGQSEAAQRWEAASDYALHNAPAGARLDISSPPGAQEKMLSENPWMAKVPPETMTYGAYTDARHGLGFNHLTDELRNAVNPESGLPQHLLWKYQDLDKVTVPQAVQRAHDINTWRAAQKAEADAARANNAAAFTHKDYEDAPYKWVELKAPEVDLKDLGYGVEEVDGLFHAVDPKGYVVVGSRAQSADEALARAKSSLPAKELEDALKYEGETMGHCVGGYCPDVLEGRSRIFSLRNKKTGEPHVTIETSPSSSNSIKAMREGAPTDFDIVQIKGKANKAPKEEYLPYVQDFVRSGQWGRVGDLENTGLHDIGQFPKRQEALGSRFVTEKELTDHLDSFGGEHKKGFADGGLVEPPLPAAEFSPLEMDYIIGNVTSGQHEPAYAEGGIVESTHIPYDEAKISSLVNALREELHA